MEKRKEKEGIKGEKSEQYHEGDAVMKTFLDSENPTCLTPKPLPTTYIHIHPAHSWCPQFAVCVCTSCCTHFKCATSCSAVRVISWSLHGMFHIQSITDSLVAAWWQQKKATAFPLSVSTHSVLHIHSASVSHQSQLFCLSLSYSHFTGLFRALHHKLEHATSVHFCHWLLRTNIAIVFANSVIKCEWCVFSSARSMHILFLFEQWKLKYVLTEGTFSLIFAVSAFRIWHFHLQKEDKGMLLGMYWKTTQYYITTHIRNTFSHVTYCNIYL